MLWGGPLAWATGTDFDPYFNDANQIAIRIDLSDDDDRANYESLLRWIDSSIPGEATELNEKNAMELWESLSLYAFTHCIHHLCGPH
jgi:hypothetical protein